MSVSQLCVTTKGLIALFAGPLGLKKVIGLAIESCYVFFYDVSKSTQIQDEPKISNLDKGIMAGEVLLQRLYFWATDSRIQPIIDSADTYKRHWDGVVRWFQSKIINGLLEGMNSLIQAVKARLPGF